MHNTLVTTYVSGRGLDCQFIQFKFIDPSILILEIESRRGLPVFIRNSIGEQITIQPHIRRDVPSLSIRPIKYDWDRIPKVGANQSIIFDGILVTPDRNSMLIRANIGESWWVVNQN